MLNLTYNFSAELWATEGKGAWHFFTVPPTPSQDIKSFLNPNRTGWGAVRVRVTIGNTSWETSIFPESRTGQFILPVKKEVRQKEHLEAGQSFEVKLEISL